MAKKKDGNYEVGYGKPPRGTQFRKGRSGNPRGRPRGARGFNTLVKEAICEQVEVRENGRLRKVSKGEVIITQTVNKAATGDYRAREFLFNKFPWLQQDAVESKKHDLTPEALEKAGELIRGIL